MTLGAARVASTEIVAAAGDADALVVRDGRTRHLRWVLLTCWEETSLHAGRADGIREDRRPDRPLARQASSQVRTEPARSNHRRSSGPSSNEYRGFRIPPLRRSTGKTCTRCKHEDRSSHARGLSAAPAAMSSVATLLRLNTTATGSSDRLNILMILV